MSELKEKLYSDFDDIAPPSQMRLVLNGDQLMDTQTLSDTGLLDQPDQVVHLIVRLRGGGGGPVDHFSCLRNSTYMLIGKINLY